MALPGAADASSPADVTPIIVESDVMDDAIGMRHFTLISLKGRNLSWTFSVVVSMFLMLCVVTYLLLPLPTPASKHRLHDGPSDTSKNVIPDHPTDDAMPGSHDDIATGAPHIEGEGCPSALTIDATPQRDDEVVILALLCVYFRWVDSDPSGLQLHMAIAPDGRHFEVRGHIRRPEPNV